MGRKLRSELKLKPLEIIIIKESKNQYSGGMKWINSSAIELCSSNKKDFIRHLFYSISDFFPETYIDNNLTFAKECWDFWNSDIPYEMGINYLLPYWEIIRKRDSDTWDINTIPLIIYNNFSEFDDEGALHWDYQTLYLRIIEEQFGSESYDWSFESEEEYIQFFQEEKLPLPSKEDTKKTRLEWLIEKDILKLT